MTNDKLRMLLSWIDERETSCMVSKSEQCPVHIDGDDLRAEIRRLLSETPSHAPAAAPSEDNLSIERMTALQDRAMGKKGVDPITPVEVQQLIGEVLFCHAKIAAMEPKIVALEAANVEWAKRFNEQPPAPAAPVTDEAQAAIDAGVQQQATDYELAYRSAVVLVPGLTAEPFHEAVANLRALIARRVQQATAAAEELALRAEWLLEEYPEGQLLHSGKAESRMARLRTALAAFRAAQGGGK